MAQIKTSALDELDIRVVRWSGHGDVTMRVMADNHDRIDIGLGPDLSVVVALRGALVLAVTKLNKIIRTWDDGPPEYDRWVD
jgi:hypothetical protein